MEMLHQRIVPVPIEDELTKSYMEYSLAVNIARALPDARDGLKHSQRRILVAMNDLNLLPGRGYRKCAKIAGDTSGNYHPHGEAIIYPTLVRMAQDFSLRSFWRLTISRSMGENSRCRAVIWAFVK